MPLGCGDQLPGSIEAIALGRSAEAEDGLTTVDAPALSGSFHALGDEGLAGGLDDAEADREVLGAEPRIIHA